MRPRGEIREAIAQAIEQLIVERGFVVDGVAVDGVTWRDAAERAQVGFDMAQRTVENMVRAEQLVRISSTKRAGSQHWEGLYAPATLRKPEYLDVTSLHDVMPRLIAASPQD